MNYRVYILETLLNFKKGDIRTYSLNGSDLQVHSQYSPIDKQYLSFTGHNLTGTRN